jgi:hypothetical protein
MLMFYPSNLYQFVLVTLPLFSCLCFQLLNKYSFISAVRAGTGANEVGIWAGDLVGR